MELNLRPHLLSGHVIPALPLALDAQRRWDEKHQRALVRYYLDAGSGGLAVGVHSTQFEIRQPEHGLFEPVLRLAMETASAEWKRQPRPVAMIAGICGHTRQALRESALARSLGYHAGLLSMAAFKSEPEKEILSHVAQVGGAIPIIGFYLQPAVGGRVFSHDFWRRFAEIPEVVAVKIAPFNRYQTLDVIRAVVAAGRDDVALYTGNDDTIVTDLLTPFRFEHAGRPVIRRITGGLLGHWGVWTHAAVKLFREIKAAREAASLDAAWLTRAGAVTDMNAAVFDAAHQFHGCIPGILEVLRRQGLVATAHCLNPDERLSPGQADELSRVAKAYPDLVDNAFVAANLDRWLES